MKKASQRTVNRKPATDLPASELPIPDEVTALVRSAVDNGRYWIGAFILDGDRVRFTWKTNSFPLTNLADAKKLFAETLDTIKTGT